METETIECKICGSIMSQLGRHLVIKHGIDGKEYQERFPNAPLMSDVRKKKNAYKSISPNNIEFWMKKYSTLEEAEQALINHKKKISINSKKTSPFSLQYFIDSGLNETEAKLRLSENNRRDKNYFVEKYGEVLGKQKFESMNSRKSYSNSKQKLIDNGKSNDEILNYSQYIWNQTSKEAFVKRYGDDGLKLYDEYCLKQKIKSKRSLEYWLNLGLSEKEAKRELNIFQSRGLKFWIEKFGNEEGLIKYKKWIEKVREHSNLSGISESSQDFFEKFFSVFTKASNIQYYRISGNEYSINNQDGFKLFLDCYFEYIGKRYGIEYHGDYWHANPKLYESNDLISYPGKKLFAREVWNRDKLKHLDFEKEDIKIFHVWESDVELNTDIEINKIIKYIEEG